MRSNPPNVDVIIIDCLTLLVSNLLLRMADKPYERPAHSSGIEHSSGSESHTGDEHFSLGEHTSDTERLINVEYFTANDRMAAAAIDQELNELQGAIRENSADWILVSNEVGMGLVPPYPQGRIYRDLLGWANQRMASKADQVYFMIAGIPMRLTPEQ